MAFRKILIANRGEIACRIMKTAHRLGYRTVAVHSSVDAGALHVRMADEAVEIGAAPAAASYLNVDAIIAAARRTGAQAVHPGYGFLSERADFARACADAGLVFIGPPASAIEIMADKAAAKRCMIAAGIPCVEGYLGEDASEARLQAEASPLGFPLLIKAVAGGGGRGMRLVRNAGEMASAIAAARREAESAFGDGALMLERPIDGARHIEIQVFGDSFGQFVHLGERDCTTQRRRQKVIEECPAPFLTKGLRETLCQDAITAARAVEYRGAGTVEFLVDQAGKHYFLEMNTRLQVEHPVTECVTGLDMVEWQLRIASGAPLPLRQEEICLSGHAIEVRLCAEDPYSGWTPQTGTVLGWSPETAGLRIDHGVTTGTTISSHYDSLVAKVIAHGVDRPDAIRRLTRALATVPLFGLVTTSGLLRDLLVHPQFVDGSITTTTLDDWQEGADPIFARPQPPEDAWRIAAAILARNRAERPDSVASFDLSLSCGAALRQFRVPDDDIVVEMTERGEMIAIVDGLRTRLHAAITQDAVHLALEGMVHVFREVSPWPRNQRLVDPSRARAPVAGLVTRVPVRPGDRVAQGQALANIEAMKMDITVFAEEAGRIRSVHIETGASVAAGDVLIDLDIET